MYRIRTIDNILGSFQELDNQEIYFSDISSLNDPMEGFCRYFWAGDAIVWRNLLKHYLLCLELVHLETLLTKDDFTFLANSIPVWASEDRLPTIAAKETYKKICDSFFSNEYICKYLSMVSSLPSRVGQEELYIHLKSLHLIAFQTILDEFGSKGFIPNHPGPPPEMWKPLLKLIDAWQVLNLNSQYDTKKYDELFLALKLMMEEIELLQTVRSGNSMMPPKERFVVLDFPKAYLNCLIRLTFPETYVACFSEECTNASNWSHYGDRHKGVCLKFRTNKLENKTFIELNQIVGFSGKPIYGYRKMLFHRIEYTNQFIDIDFFKSLAQLTTRQLITQWYTGSDGVVSPLSRHMTDKEARLEWHEQFALNCDQRLLCKLRDWDNEKEHRLILIDAFNSFIEVKDRKLKYRFEDLEAVIFGERTAIEDKIAIIRIIERKCIEIGRKVFDFYQAHYSPAKGSMEISKLDALGKASKS